VLCGFDLVFDVEALKSTFMEGNYANIRPRDGAERAHLSSEWMERLRAIPCQDFSKFDVLSAERRELINRKVFKEEDIVSSRTEEKPLLVSLLGVVLEVPAGLNETESLLFCNSADSTLDLARLVSYEKPPNVMANVTPEQRGFLETMLVSATSSPNGARIVGKLSSFDAYWGPTACL
ncbi:hypothetical protein FOL46_001774, partial [Perkinsus olseni]